MIVDAHHHVWTADYPQVRSGMAAAGAAGLVFDLVVRRADLPAGRGVTA